MCCLCYFVDEITDFLTLSPLFMDLWLLDQHYGLLCRNGWLQWHEGKMVRSPLDDIPGKHSSDRRLFIHYKLQLDSTFCTRKWAWNISPHQHCLAFCKYNSISLSSHSLYPALAALFFTLTPAPWVSILIHCLMWHHHMIVWVTMVLQFSAKPLVKC